MVKCTGQLLTAAAERTPVKHCRWKSLNLSLLEAVWTQCTGVVVRQVGFDIDDICPGPPHPHHVKAFSSQVVTRDK